MRLLLASVAALSLSLVGVVPASGAGGERSCTAPPVPDELVVDPATVGSPVGEGRPADPAMAREVRAGVRNFMACINAGDHLRASTLFTANFVSNFMGQTRYEDVPLVLGGLTMSHMRIDEIRVYDDGSFSTDGTYLAYGHKITHERTFWWPKDGVLQVNGIQPLEAPIPPGSAEIDIEMGEYFYRLSTTTVCGPDVVLRLRNVGQAHHEAIVMQLPDGAVPEDLFNGNLAPEDVTTIGHDNGAPVMPLIKLRPGTYTLVDFIPAEDGVPNALHGQVAQFTVTRC